MFKATITLGYQVMLDIVPQILVNALRNLLDLLEHHAELPQSVLRHATSVSVTKKRKYKTWVQHSLQYLSDH